MFICVHMYVRPEVDTDCLSLSTSPFVLRQVPSLSLGLVCVADQIQVLMLIKQAFISPTDPSL